MRASDKADATADRLFLGIDGGGTKTRAVVVDSAGVERGSATTDCSNHKVAGLDVAVRHIMDAAHEAGRVAGQRGPYTAAWVGLAGVDGAADLALLMARLESLAATVRVTNDAELLLAALPDQVGIALIAGTGSIAVGRNAGGATLRAGGWGRLLSDEGSGYGLGQQALVAALRAADGRGQPTTLLDRILVAWDVATVEEVADRVYREQSANVIAALAPLTLQAARAGDAAARRIVRHGALELARTGIALARRLSADAAPIGVALGGSVLLRDAGYREAVVTAFAHRIPLGAVVMVEQPALCAARAAIAPRR